MLGGSVGPGVGLLPLTLFPHRSLPEVPETIELEVRTSTASGLLVWQGEETGQSGRGKDFISLGLQDGHLIFRWVLAPPVPSLTPLILQWLSLRSPPSQTPHYPRPVLPPAHTLLGPCACSYQLGSGEARLVSEDPINDGEWHRVTALR